MFDKMKFIVLTLEVFGLFFMLGGLAISLIDNALTAGNEFMIIGLLVENLAFTIYYGEKKC